MIHREGFATLLLVSVVLGLLNWVVATWVGNIYIQNGLLLVSLSLFIIVLQFFRNPSRNTAVDEAHIIAPCDGKVVVIEEVEEKEYFKGKRIQISIFMSPFNVHVNRNPVSGQVMFSKYHPGKYLVAWHPKSSEENERTTVVIKNKAGHEILFRQIAGALARRIVNYLKEGQPVKQGAEMGFIKFGSRVDIFVPVGTKINCQLGDKTRGGETVIASFES
jgi:phosphatidylserine decarboxylase